MNGSIGTIAPRDRYKVIPSIGAGYHVFDRVRALVVSTHETEQLAKSDATKRNVQDAKAS